MGRKVDRLRQQKANWKRIHDAAQVNVDEIGEIVNKRRRAAAEKSLLAFLKSYCVGTAGGFLEVAPKAEGMIKIIEDIEAAIAGSGWYHVRMPRGHGKTSFVKGGIAWALATGRRRYVVAVAAAASNAVSIVRDVFAFFEQSEPFAEDFPEFSTFFQMLGGKSQRAKSITYQGEPVNIRVNAAELNLPTVKGFDNTGGVLQAVGFSANARGKVKGALRPDLVLFDDLQNEKLAGNQERVKDAERNIEKNFLNLGGHRKSIAALMTSTPIEPDDLSEIFAAKSTWKTSTYTMFVGGRFPAAMNTLWKEYGTIRRHEMIEGRNPASACKAFYKKHREAMDKGSEVLNPANYDKRLEVSAIQHAMNLYFNGEEQFMSEYQMQPKRAAAVFVITPSLVLSRVRSGVGMGTIPPRTVLITAATDINPSYAISTVITAWTIDRTAFVPFWFIEPVSIDGKLNETEFNQRVFGALVKTGRRLAECGLKIGRWGIDGGGRQFNAVTQFAAAGAPQIGINALAMVGRAGRNWNPNVRSRVRDASNDTVLCSDGRSGYWLAWNADSYKEMAQRAWITEIGAPGGLSLFDGGLGVSHDEFAVQVTNEILRAKRTTGAGQTEYQWQTKEPHDLGDCVAMNYALAGAEGITGGLMIPTAARRVFNPAMRNTNIRRF